MEHAFRILLEIKGECITRYKYEFYPDFHDQNGHNQKELGEKIIQRLDIPGGWDKSTIDDRRLGILFRWMGGVQIPLKEFAFSGIVAELKQAADIAQEYITDAIQKATIAKIAMSDK